MKDSEIKMTSANINRENRKHDLTMGMLQTVGAGDMSGLKRRLAGVVMASVVMAGVVTLALGASASAQDRQILGSFGDWDAQKITRSGAKECFMVSTAKKWTANKKNVSRGDIYMTIAHKPSLGVKGEVSVTVGYPLKPDSELVIRVDGKKRFELFTEGGTAWTYDPQDDASLVTAMKQGNSLVATASSSRGTQTTDTYSLKGFTAAYNAISKACP